MGQCPLIGTYFHNKCDECPLRANQEVLYDWQKNTPTCNYEKENRENGTNTGTD